MKTISLVVLNKGEKNRAKIIELAKLLKTVSGSEVSLMFEKNHAHIVIKDNGAIKVTKTEEEIAEKYIKKESPERLIEL
jgi:Mn-dependent DtxR family transcriptional regulator